MEDYKIYSLNDPKTNEVRYIGKTVSSLSKRLSSHYRDKSHSYKTHWICSLKEDNLKPIIKLIEICSRDNWEEREKYWISYYRKITNLTNYLDGGQGQQKGYKHTDEAKEKIRLAAIKNEKGKFCKGQKFSDEINHKRIMALKKKIYQYDLEGNLIKKWNGIIDASEELGANQNNIISALKGRSLTACGFMWSYENKKIVLKNKKSSREIFSINIENKEVEYYNSISECANILKIERKHIENSLRSGTIKFNKIFKYK